MTMPARLQINGHLGIEIQRAAELLLDLKYAYDSISVALAELDKLERYDRRGPFSFYLLRDVRHIRYWDESPTREIVSNLVPFQEQLVIASATFNTPGFWEVVGSLNPLEVIRNGLNDHHNRRKDKKYRNSAEERKLDLENQLLENKVLAEKIQMAKDLGATNNDLAPLLNSLVGKPLQRLTNHQNDGLIEDARFVDVSSGTPDTEKVP